jgi:cytochrome c-type biogenesis protein CcmH/NrfF
LLLVIVIQNSVYHASSERPYAIGDMNGIPSGEAVENIAPHVDQKPHMGAEMVFHALKAFPKGCVGKRILAECDSPEANEVKARIEKMAEGGKSIREVFDSIVATWTESVLTDEAKQIRSQRKQGH